MLVTRTQSLIRNALPLPGRTTFKCEQTAQHADGRANRARLRRAICRYVKTFPANTARSGIGNQNVSKWAMLKSPHLQATYAWNMVIEKANWSGARIAARGYLSMELTCRG